MWASARRHPEMMQLLISKGADVNARSIDRDYQRHVTAEGRPKSLDSGGFTPLLYAARENCMACVDVLLKNKADIDLPDPDGVSPLLVAIMNANWDLAKQLIAGRRRRQSVGHLRRGAAVHGGRPAQSRSTADARRSIRRTRPPAWRSSTLLLERGANPNMQLFFKPANVRGATNTRGATPLIRAATNGDLEVVKLLLEHGADATRLHGGPADADPCRARRPRAGAAGAGTDHASCRRPARTSTSSRWSTTRRRSAAARRCTTPSASATKRSSSSSPSFGIDMNAMDQDGLTALDYTQSRGFMPFMALQTPLYKEEAALLRELGATKLMDRSARVAGPRPAAGHLGQTSGRSASREFMSRSTSARSTDHRGSTTAVASALRAPDVATTLSAGQRGRCSAARCCRRPALPPAPQRSHESQPPISAARRCSRAPAAT